MQRSNWDVNNCEYNQASEKEQIFKVKGNVVLPDNVNNDQNASTEVTISVNVNEKAVVVQSPEDNKPPVITLKGSITVGGKVYSDYSDKIVFNTELTGIQKGVITASDEQDEIASISYLKSASALSQDQLDQSTGWIDGKEFTLTEGERLCHLCKIRQSLGRCCICVHPGNHSEESFFLIRCNTIRQCGN